ncbi:hypothetical protein ACFRMN_10180 [Streptomyces sp. NPDC056835]|uniref:hypothetical protein n=1 Tax=Streptomyces sp. NPDC056835 TaxID=3345956 RepID=UPI0036A015A3
MPSANTVTPTADPARVDAATAHSATVDAAPKWGERCPRPTAENTRVTVVGEPRSPEDTLPRDVLIDRVRASDLIVFPYAGSCGWEFATHSLLGLGHPVAERRLL